MLRLLQSEPKDLPLLKPERTPLPPSKDSLSPQQKILTSPVAAKAIDWLSGGASLPDAQQYAGQQVENIKNIPKVIPALNPFTPLDKQEKALEAFSTPLETISRVPTALQKLAFPTEEQGRLESAVKALIRPDKVPSGYLGGEISKSMPPPKKEVSMLSPRVLVPGLAGTVGEILSFELGLGTMFSRLAKGYQSAKMRGAAKDMDDLLNQATKKAVEVAETKGVYPKDWNPADKFGRTKAELRKKFETNPELGDALMKRQSPTRIFSERLMNKRGTAELPNPQAPKPKDLLAPAEALSKNMADLAPKDNIVRDQQEKPIEINAEQPLIEEAKKYKTAEEFVQAKISKEVGFRDYHQAPRAEKTPVEERMDTGGDFSLREVVKGKSTAPEDFFDKKVGARYYMYDTLEGRQSETAIDNIRRAEANGITDRTITAYRVVPEGVNIDSLQNGDWVSFSKEYATQHGERRFDGKYKLIEQEVSPDEVWWDANDINEWGYDNGSGQERVTQDQRKKQLTSIWQQAQEPSTTPPPSGRVSQQKQLSAETAEDVLKHQIGDTFKKVEPVGDLWKSKGNVVFIKPSRDKIGFAAWLRTKNFIDNVDEAGNGIYRVKVKPRSASDQPSQLASAGTPPAEPPKTTFEQPMPEEPDDFFGKEKEADLLKQFNQELDSLTKNLKKSVSGKIKLSLKGGEEEKLIPQDLISKSGGQTLDELAQENTDSLMALGYEANDEGLRQFIQDNYGQLAEEAKGKQMARIAQASNRDDLRKLVSQIDRRLGKQLPKSQVKPSITASTGVQKVKSPTTIEESKLLKLRFQQQAKGARAGFSEGRFRGKEEEKGRVRDVLKRKKGRSGLAESIKKKIKFIKEASTKDLPVEYKDMIDDIKQSVNFERAGLRKILKKEKISRKLEEEGLIKQVNDLSNITASEMNLEELDLVYDTIERLYHEGYNANKFLSVKEENDFNAAVLKGTESIESSGGIPKVPSIERKPYSLTDKPKHIKDKYIAENRRPEAVIESFDKYKEEGINYRIMFKPLNKAANEKLDNIEATAKKISEIFKNVNISEALGKRVKIKGISRPLLRDEMLFIYANTFNDFNLDHLLGSGVNEEAIYDVTKKLKDEEKKAVRDLIKYYDDVQYDRLDAVYSRLKGKHVKKEENYFPIMGLENVGDIDAIEMNVDQRAKFLSSGISQSMTKERVGGQKAYKSFSFFRTVYKNINQVEHYISHAEAVRDVSKYLKNEYISQAIKDNYGDPTYNMLDKWLADVARGRDENFGKFFDDFVTALRANYVLYALGANISTVVKQPASFIQGAEYIGKSWALGSLVKFGKNPLKMIKNVRGKSSQMRHRRFSQERELQEMLKGRGIAKKFGQKDLREIEQMIREGSMMPIMWADQMTVTVLWDAAYEKKISELGISGLSDAEKEQQAIDIADKSIRRTQPQARLVDLPEMFRADPVRKMFMVFKNQPNQNFNLLYDSYLKFKQAGGDAGSFKKFSSEIFYYLVVSGLFFSVLMRHRAPKNKGEVAWSIANQAFGGLPLISEVLSTIEYPWGTSTFLESLTKDAARIITSKPKNKLKYSLDTAAKLRGIPGYVAGKRILTRDTLKTKLVGGQEESKPKNRIKNLRLLGGAKTTNRVTKKKLRLLQ